MAVLSSLFDTARVVALALLAAPAIGVASAQSPGDKTGAFDASAPWSAVVADACAWEGYSWDQLPPDAQRAWESLGWTQQKWDADDAAQQPRAENSDWLELSKTQRAAARRLGYDQRIWNSGGCR